MSAKSLDPKGRFRGKIVSFRCSEEENAALDVAAQLSGLTKQDYIISRILQRDIIVQPNPRVYKALKDRLELVLTELKKNEEAATNSDLLEIINLIAVTLNGIKGGEG
ncbi:MAG: plasmid mobilization protein [Ruminiclostridium sp.]